MKHKNETTNHTIAALEKKLARYIQTTNNNKTQKSNQRKQHKQNQKQYSHHTIKKDIQQCKHHKQN